MKILQIIILFFLLVFSTNSALLAKETTFRILPVPLYLEGMGSILGVALQYQTERKSEIVIGGAAAEHDQRASRYDQRASGLYSKLAIKDDIFLFGAMLKAKDLKLPSSYTRGTTRGTDAKLYRTVVDLDARALGTNLGFQLAAKHRLQVNFSLNLIDQKFAEFLDQDFNEVAGSEVIYASTLKLTSQVLSLAYSYQEKEKKDLANQGWKFLSQITRTSQTSNTWYSGTQKLDYNLVAHLPIFKSVYLVPRVFYSAATVTQAKESNVGVLRSHFIATSDDVASCNSHQESQGCEELVDKLAKNLAAHNKYGTATPLGGSDQLRSFALFRFKGSRSEYTSLELRYPFFYKKFKMEPSLFIEQGRTFDPNSSERKKEFIKVYGLEYRFVLSESLVYKALWAESETANAFQLAVDSAW